MPGSAVRLTRHFCVFIAFMLAAYTARAEQGKDISGGDIAVLLLGVAALFFLGNLILAGIVFFVGNALSTSKRRKIWGTYGMTMLGTLVSFAILRNGPAGDGSLSLFLVICALVFGTIGYLISPMDKNQQAEEDI